jgi:DNA-binding transcriptional ArsR family regulator
MAAAVDIPGPVAERLADVMHALSTPSRVQILGCLSQGPMPVGAIATALGMEQSAVSHQLRVLRVHQLVHAERSGRLRVYRLFDGHVTTLLRAAVDHVTDRG